ncbi:MAG: hypothetical protein JXQ82_10090 [Methanomicrobiaceae archaeon]|nr:hypothetical protein [Methanomicrobiaceae archaeon]
MKLKNTSLFFIAALIVILILSFAAGCISEGHTDEQSDTLDSKDTNLSDLKNPDILPSADNSLNNNTDTNPDEPVLNEKTGVQTDNEKDYTPLWSAGIIASDEDFKSYCLITKFIPETNEYYIKDIVYPPGGSPYVQKDDSLGGMGKKYKAADIDQKYSVFSQKAVKIPICAKGSSDKIVGYLERDTKESMKVDWTA